MYGRDEESAAGKRDREYAEKIGIKQIQTVNLILKLGYELNKYILTHFNLK